MLKRFFISLALFLALTTVASAQVVIPGSQPNPDFPAPTGPGSPKDMPATYGVCLAVAKHMAHGTPLAQYVQGCMSSKGYSILHGTMSCYAMPPIDAIGRKYPNRAACESSDNAYLHTGDSYFPTPWQMTVSPVAYDPAAPGPRLLLLAKKLADQGQLDNPASVANILNLPLIHSTHSESGPTSCASVPQGDSGYDISDGYVVTGNGWFRTLATGKNLIVDPNRHSWGLFSPPPGSAKDVPLGAPTFSYEIKSGISCPASSPRDGVGASIVFDNIPAYACISDSLVRTIFPPGPLDELPRVVDGDGPDFAYFHKDVGVYFSMVWVEWRPAQSGGQPSGQPNCLQAISIGSHYPFGPLHKANLTGKYSMPAKIAALPDSTGAAAHSTNPAEFLLERVKALADNAQITDPVAASSILDLPLVLNRYDVDGTVSCAEFPGGRRFVSDDYGMGGDGWFHALPTGKRLLFVSPVYAKNYVTIIGHTTFPLDPPSFHYGTDAHESCTPSPNDDIDFGISFANIPSYACIGPQQIKANFPGLHVPTGAEALDMRPDFTYISAHSWVQFFMATNPWAVMTAPRLAPHQPNCLTLIQLYALHDLTEQKREFAQMQAARKDMPPQAPPPPPLP